MGISTIVTMLGIGAGTTVASMVLGAIGQEKAAKLTEVLGVSIMAGTVVSSLISLSSKLTKLV